MTNYKIIIYKLIIFEVTQQNRVIKKKYFQKIKTINNINVKDLTKKFIEYKAIYKDNCYIFSEIKQDENDWYFENLNNKSYKDYVNFINRGYKKETT